MAAIFEKSRTWRRIVALGKASPAFFWGFTATTFGAAGLLAYATQKATDRNTDEFREELLKRSRKDAVLVNSANKERLGQLLREIQLKDDFEDRYKAALNGETLTGEPGARVRGGSGTSATAEWVARAAEAQRAALEKEGKGKGLEKAVAEKVLQGAKSAKKHGAESAMKQGADSAKVEAVSASSRSGQGSLEAESSGKKEREVPLASLSKVDSPLGEKRQSSWWSWGKATG